MVGFSEANSWPALSGLKGSQREYRSIQLPVLDIDAKMRFHSEVAIVGAGPYGLSLAAHLNSRRVPVRVFGKPMEFWLNHMPKGMCLKSDGFASSLYHPAGILSLEQFCRENGLMYDDTAIPVPLQTFTSYGLSFQNRFVPNVDERNVARVTALGMGFKLELENGEILNVRKLIIAVGVSYFKNLPMVFENLRPEFVSHSSDHHELESFKKRNVVVVGAGASATDMAALLYEAGAAVQLVARETALRFHGRGDIQRSLWRQIRHPSSGIGPGWRNRFYSEAPWLFHTLPQHLRLTIVKRTLGPAGGWFIKDRIIGKVPTVLGFSPEAACVKNEQVHLRLRGLDGTTRDLVADHVVLATGFRVDVRRLNFLVPELQSQIRSVENTPILSSEMESSVRGLYFVGAASANSFGPVMRFAYGARFTAPFLSDVISKSVARGT